MLISGNAERIFCDPSFSLFFNWVKWKIGGSELHKFYLLGKQRIILLFSFTEVCIITDAFH